MTRFTHRAVRWERLKGARAYAALTIGTAGGAGLFPFAPGTMGTLAAVPLVYLTAGAHPVLRALLWAALLAAGTWAARVLDEVMGSSDNQSIVMDEVVGFGITAWTAANEPYTLLAAFVAFRAFDILKLPPARQMDRWSKNQKGRRWQQGFGVMADDVIAGFQGLALIMLAQHLGWLP